MGWEQRGGVRYYYRAKRDCGRVVKEYIGTGRVAELMATHDELERAERTAATDAIQRAKTQLQELGAALTPLDEVADTLAALVLVAAGFHRTNRGPWRKRRE